MTLLGGEPPKIDTGAISPGVIRATDIRVGTIEARNIRLTRLDAHGTPVPTNMDTITIDVPFVSPEVIRLMWGQPPYGHEFDGETLL